MMLSGRSKRVGISAVAGAGARVVTMLCSLIAVPICLNYLGKETFGIWATITSLVAVLAFADLGIGNGILNRIATAQGRQDKPAVRRSFASALVLLVAIAGLVLSICLVLYALVPFDMFFPDLSAHPEQGAIVTAVLVFAVLFALNLPTSIIQRVQYALQLGYLNGLTQGLGGVVSLALVYLMTMSTLGLGGMIAATMLAPVLATLVGAAWMFHRYPELRISARDFDVAEARGIFNSGMQFLTMGIAFSLCYSTDNLIIASVVGAESVADYAVHQKYFTPVTLMAALILTPLWPAYAEALAAGDRQWIKQMFTKTIRYFLIFATSASVLLIIAAPSVLKLWVGEHVPANFWLLIGFGIWATCDLIGKTVSMFLNGIGMIKEQFWIAIAFVPVCLALKVLFAHEWGATGVPFATALAYLIVHAVPYVILVGRWFRESSHA